MRDEHVLRLTLQVAVRIWVSWRKERWAEKKALDVCELC